MTLDLAIRGGTVVTAADTTRCDVGIRDGRIVSLGEDVGPAARTIDATGLLVLPGGIDSHVHLDQFSGDDILMADGFESGTRSAAAGGNTCVIPFALQRRGESLARQRRGLPCQGGGPGARRLQLPPHHHRPEPAGARPGAAGARQGRLHLLQGVHDL